MTEVTSAGIMPGGRHFINAAVVIGNDVWIGQDVFIKSGVSIGDGAIIGERSVVTNDIPPYSFAVGSPAKVLRQRFDEALIARIS
jgi:virginiamycin A acetyltransferase